MSKDFWEYYLKVHTGKDIPISSSDVEQFNRNVAHSDRCLAEVIHESGYHLFKKEGANKWI